MPLPRTTITRTVLAKIAAATVVVVAAVAFLIGPKPDKPITSPDVVAASGAATVDVIDPIHDRPFEVSTWTPAGDDNNTLVVISHGFSGDRTSHDSLAASLAAAGYTVAAPTHPDMAGLTSSDPRLDPLVLRPRHLSLTIDHMTTAAPFGRVVVIGHSLGGYSAVRAAGATPSASHLDDHCAANTADVVLCGPAARARIEQLVSDPVDATDARIDAIVLLAPGYGPLFSSTDLDEIDSTVLVIAAESDDQLPGEQVNALVSALPSDTSSVTVAGGHYVFLRTCTETERQTLPELCMDGPSVDRAQVHAEVTNEIEAFLNSF